MWQFVAHHVMRPPLWAWRRLDKNGATAQQSAGSFASYRKAYADAVRHGFKPGLDEHEKLDIKSEVESKKSKV
jgi:hypothetical protein